MAIPAIYNNEVFTKMSSVAKHSFEHASGSFIVKSFVEDHVFYDENGCAEAVINTIAYT